MTPLERADYAEQMLKNPVFKAAMADIRAGLMAKLENCAPGDVDTQHEIALLLQMARKFELQLMQFKSAISVDNAEKRQRSFVERLKAMNPV